MVLVALESVVRLMVIDGQRGLMVVPVLMAVAVAAALLLPLITTAVAVVVVRMLVEPLAALVLLL